MSERESAPASAPVEAVREQPAQAPVRRRLAEAPSPTTADRPAEEEAAARVPVPALRHGWRVQQGGVHCELAGDQPVPP
jgi:hypothetical protein